MASSAASRKINSPENHVIYTRQQSIRASHSKKSVDAKLSSIMLDDIHYPTNGRYEIVKSTR